MRNIELMKKVKDLATQHLGNSDHSSRVMVQIAIIRQAFGVKNDEHEKPFRDYERDRVLSDDEIRKVFQQRVDFFEWAVKENNSSKIRQFGNQIMDFIDAVRFFHKELADEFEEVRIQLILAYELEKVNSKKQVMKNSNT